MARFRIRPVLPGDVESIARLCEEHAEYERNPVATALDRVSLAKALFSDPPKLRGLAVSDEDDGRIVGYATYTVDFSTWRTMSYLHLDCLYLQAEYRGLGIGQELMAEIRAEAGRLGCSMAEWQTPVWNEAAGRFYLRLGATEQAKRRFTWKVGG